MTTSIIIDSEQVNSLYLKDLWSYRSLFFFLAWRDILVRYKQAFFGFAWAFLRPLFTTIAFVFVFGHVAGLNSSTSIPYPIYVFCALLQWQLFSAIVSEGGGSLVGHAHMISKVYFPRMIIPLSSVVINLLDFGISCLILVAMMIYYKIGVGLNLIAFPLAVMLNILFSVGIVLWISALTARYRDFRFVISFLLQFGLYSSPIGFSTKLISQKYQSFYFLNPMVGIIDLVRWSLFSEVSPHLEASIIATLVISIILIISGFYYFLKSERWLADII